jgi:nucleoside recognition membrane protein YjiH
MKKILLILTFLIVGCGYQPIYLKTDEQIFKFSKILIQKDDEISKKIVNLISFTEDENR